MGEVSLSGVPAQSEETPDNNVLFRFHAVGLRPLSDHVDWSGSGRRDRLAEPTTTAGEI